jgi:hypothetical protein
MTRTFMLAGAMVVALTVGGWGVAEAQFNSSTMGVRKWVRAHAPSRSFGAAGAGASMGGAIAIGEVRNLDFGEVIAGDTPGTVVMSPAGARSFTGGVALGDPVSAGPATFSVTGDPGAGYSILLPGPLELHNGPHRMTLDPFTSDPDGLGLLNGSGIQTLKVGATLNVGANQTPGMYTRVFHVTVAYE